MIPDIAVAQMLVKRFLAKDKPSSTAAFAARSEKREEIAAIILAVGVRIEEAAARGEEEVAVCPLAPIPPERAPDNSRSPWWDPAAYGVWLALVDAGYYPKIRGSTLYVPW